MDRSTNQLDLGINAQSAPLSALALGTISFDGARNKPCERITRIENYVLIDNKHCFTEVPIDHPLYGSAVRWMRIPHFFHTLSKTDQQALECCFQINDLRAHADQDFPQHALYNPKTKNVTCICLADPQSGTVTSSDAFYSELEAAEYALHNCDHERAQTFLSTLTSENHPRLLFLRGALAFALEQYDQAKGYFHQAALFGHPDALEAEWKTSAFLTRELRQAYPEAFNHIDRGEPLRALTVLRSICDQYPPHAAAILAYCLRAAGVPDEGIKLCKQALRFDSEQSDVYGHLWSYYNDLKQDDSAYAIARLHLQHYPTSAQAYLDALDSALITNRLEVADAMVHGYLLHTDNICLALKQLFKYFEAKREWQTLKHYFEIMSASAARLTPELHALHGEVLVECDDFSVAADKLDLALRAAPQDAQIVLAYARMLARANKLAEATRFMTSVMNDWNRTDDKAQWYLMVAFLSELLRNQGLLDEALRLWQEDQQIGPALLNAAGPRPLVEYSYCLAESGLQEAAKSVCDLVQTEFSETYIVQQLELMQKEVT